MSVPTVWRAKIHSRREDFLEPNEVEELDAEPMEAYLATLIGWAGKKTQ